MSNTKDEKNRLAILHLEDSPLDADLIYEYLRENAEYDIQRDVVSGEKEFISAMTGKKYDLILADFSLPGFDGFAALKHARLLCPNTPYICVSGVLGEETAVELLKQGAEDYVLKDKLGRLVFSINRALNAKREAEELKQSEDALKASEDKFRYVFDNSVIGKSFTLPSGEINVNKAFCEMLGYSKEELQGTKWQEISHPDDIELTQNALNTVLSGGKDSINFIKRYIKKDGSVLWADVRSSIRRDAEGRPLYFMTSILDITERLAAEEALRTSEERYRLLFETMTTGIVCHNADGAIILANPAAEQILGLSFKQMRGKTSMDPAWKALREDGSDLPGYEHPAMVALRTGKPFGPLYMAVFQPQLNDYVWILTTASPLFKPGESSPYQVYAAFIDVTTERKAKHEYKELFTGMVDACALHEMIYDNNGNPVDYRFLSVNPAFEHLTGLKAADILGRTVLEVMPETEQLWIDTYGRVMLTGESTHLENYSVSLGKYYSVSAYRAAPNQFACTFADTTAQVMANKALQESELRYRSLFESAKDGILILDAETGKIVDVNPFLIEMLGFSKEQILKKSLWELGAFKNVVSNRENFLTLQNKGYIRYEDLPLEAFDGRMMSVEFVSNVYQVGNEKVIQCNIRDITERKQAAILLAQSNERYRAVYEQSAVGICILAMNGQVMNANDKMCAFTGYSLSELMKKRSKDFTHPEDVEATQANIDMLAAGGIPGFSIDKRYVRKDGSIVWGNLTGSLCRNASGEPLYFVAIIQDVDDKKSAEMLLLEKEERYKAITQTSISGFFVNDDQKRFVEVNDAFCVMTGYSREALLSLRIPDVDCIDTEERVAARMKTIIAGGFDHFESRLRKANGTIIDVEISINYLAQKNVFICFVNNITERKDSEKNLLYLSYHDQLTGLYNRRFFEEELKRIDTERNYPLTVVMSDINGLKIVNDAFGHETGDELLIKTAEILRKGFRADDIIARAGGDEFTVLLPRTGALQAAQIINRINTLASSEKVANIELSITFGYETKTDKNGDIQKALSNAENFMYVHKLSERSSMRSKTVDIILNTLFEKSNREMEHSKRVSEISQAIASKMNMEKDDINQIRIAGLVHDIGKIGVDEKILNKNGHLDPAELESMKKHPEIGWRILNATQEFAGVARHILEHHEKWDGSGYPKGLKGEEISLQARVIAVADAYDAITSTRSYHMARRPEDAAAEILRYSGTQFDPEIVKVFIDKVLPDSGWLTV